jgi:hypothetical protein
VGGIHIHEYIHNYTHTTHDRAYIYMNTYIIAHTHTYTPEYAGPSKYFEYPDAFVQRGLCFEGLADWENAIKDYSKVII